jgi:hypothetical protein
MPLMLFPNHFNYRVAAFHESSSGDSSSTSARERQRSTQVRWQPFQLVASEPRW